VGHGDQPSVAVSQGRTPQRSPSSTPIHRRSAWRLLQAVHAGVNWFTPRLSPTRHIRRQVADESSLMHAFACACSLPCEDTEARRPPLGAVDSMFDRAGQTC
jgi:hypothetical protein